MSIASELQTLNDKILDAYDAVNNKGGTIPSAKNMANLPTAIASISGGGGGTPDNNWAAVMRGETKGLFDNALTEIPSHAWYPQTDNGVILAEITSASFPEVTSIGDSAMRNWAKITSIHAPKMATVNSYCFYGCTKLEEADFPLADFAWTDFFGFKAYARSVFYNCAKLKKIRIKPTAGIGVEAFSKCSSLSALILLSESLIELYNANAFTSSAISGGTGYIYVRRSLVDEFKSANNWSTYASQIRAIEDYSDDGTVDGDINV